MHSALLRLLSVEGFDISAPSKMDFVLAWLSVAAKWSQVWRVVSES